MKSSSRISLAGSQAVPWRHALEFEICCIFKHLVECRKRLSSGTKEIRIVSSQKSKQNLKSSSAASIEKRTNFFVRPRLVSDTQLSFKNHCFSKVYYNAISSTKQRQRTPRVRRENRPAKSAGAMKKSSDLRLDLE